MTNITNTTFKGAVFDLDGTIIDSLPFWKNMNNYLFEKHCKGLVVDESRIRGMSLKISVEYIVDELGANATKEELLEEIVSGMKKAYLEDIPAKKEVRDIVIRLFESGVPMTVCTACDLALAKGALKRLGLIDCFSEIVSSHEISMDKTKPLIYKLMSEKMGIPISDLVMFEDTYSCMAAAKEAGMRVIAVEDEMSATDRPLIEEIADEYIVFRG